MKWLTHKYWQEESIYSSVLFPIQKATASGKTVCKSGASPAYPGFTHNMGLGAIIHTLAMQQSRVRVGD